MSPSLLQRINRRCDEFEQRWKTSPGPSIEEFLEGWLADDRRKLFGYLLDLDMDYRRIAAMRISPEDYNAQFPDYRNIIAERFATGTSDGWETMDGPTKTAAPANDLKAIGHYRVLRVLGKGGMGTVYLAYDHKLDRQVAIKMPFLGMDDSSMTKERFLREARALAAIVHPNICPIHEVGQHGDAPYMVMTYVQGKPLSDREVRPQSIDEAVEMVRKLAYALHHSHQVGVVHRDLKPSNIIMNYLDEPVIIDFGLAQLQRQDNIELTVFGTVLGTPAYMSPEQVRGETSRIGSSTDIYSLGVMLYELLASQRPFRGEMYELMRQVAEVDPPPPSSIRPEVDADLDRICRIAMAKSIDDRYSRMVEFAAALDEYLEKKLTTTDNDTRKDSKRGQTLKTGQATPLSSRATIARTKSRGPSIVQEFGLSDQAQDGKQHPPEDDLPLTEPLFTGEYGYQLVELIGQGQYGEVWLAMAPGGIEVAVKKVLFPTGHKATQTELRALELLKGLRHSLLLRVQAYWIVGDQLMIVMELADDSLEDVLKQHADTGVPREQLFGYMRESAEAIDFLNSQNVLHRDIKPANILLLGGHVKVADFGISMSGQFGRGELTVQASTLGTPMYMAPELWNQQAGPRSDQYSLAVTYVELRLGREPDFDDQDRLLLDALPAAERTVVGKALSPAPVDRYETCGEFVAALDKIIEDERNAARFARLRRRAMLAAVILLIVGTPGFLVVKSFLTKRSAAAAVPLGFAIADDARLVSDGRQYLYDKIVCTLNDGTGLQFLLIPRSDNVEMRSFYCMQHMVTNANFELFASDATFQPGMDAWQTGPWAGNDRLPASEHPNLPVVGVTPDQAHAFAVWIGGRLPTKQQWEKAAGRWDHPPNDLGPYRSVAGREPNVAINRSSEGPLPVGAATDDISMFGCRDMAGNIMEWTCTTDEPEIFVPVSQDNDQHGVFACGKDYRDRHPLTFEEMPETLPTYPSPGQHHPFGFRCIAMLAGAAETVEN